MKRYLLLILSVFLIYSIDLHAEGMKLSVSAGLSTTTFMQNSPSASLMLPSNKNGNTAIFTGGSYDGQQAGLALRVSSFIDKNENFEVPVSLYFSFLHAAERAALGYRSELYLKHKTNIQSLGLGFNYYFYKLPISGVKPYLGVEAITSYVNEDYFSRKLYYYNLNEVVNYGHNPKKAALRLGGEAKFGVSGNIIDKISLNTSIGMNAINLIGRSDSRGELLTPNKENETKESVVWNWHITFMLQYAL